jgi:hypothetical protein
MSVSSEYCVLSRTGLCDGPITRPEDPTECGVCPSLIADPHAGGLEPLGAVET